MSSSGSSQISGNEDGSNSREEVINGTTVTNGSRGSNSVMKKLSKSLSMRSRGSSSSRSNSLEAKVAAATAASNVLKTDDPCNDVARGLSHVYHNTLLPIENKTNYNRYLQSKFRYRRRTRFSPLLSPFSTPIISLIR